MPRFLMVPVISVSFLVFLVACDQTQNPDPGTQVEAPVAQSAQPSAVPAAPMVPRQPQQLSMYIVPMNPGDFSMDKIQANKRKIEESPEDVEALIALGNANFMIQRFEVTQEMLGRAVKVDPKRYKARLTLATSMVLMKNIEGALKELEDLLKVQPDHPEGLYNKGLIQLQSVGDRTVAKATWSQLVAAHPEHELAKRVQGVLGQL